MDTEKMGVDIARQCRWDPEQIAAIFVAALVDSNWHSLAEKIEKLVEIEIGKEQQ